MSNVETVDTIEPRKIKVRVKEMVFASEKLRRELEGIRDSMLDTGPEDEESKTPAPDWANMSLAALVCQLEKNMKEAEQYCESIAGAMG